MDSCIQDCGEITLIEVGHSRACELLGASDQSARASPSVVGGGRGVVSHVNWEIKKEAC